MGRSWSDIRKTLEEDLLCEKLRGRIQYFFTIYRKADDEYGRFAIIADGKELFSANSYNETVTDQYAEKLHDSDRAALKAIEDGKATTFQVMWTVRQYLNMQPEEALHDDNLLLRMFAVLDRRIGRRTLVKLAAEVDYLPRWLADIYQLRFSVEGIPFGTRAKLFLSADGDIGLYDVDTCILRDFDSLLARFVHPTCYDEQDFVHFLQKELGPGSIVFIRKVGCYPNLDAKYRNIFWYNF